MQVLHATALARQLSSYGLRAKMELLQSQRLNMPHHPNIGPPCPPHVAMPRTSEPLNGLEDHHHALKRSTRRVKLSGLTG